MINMLICEYGDVLEQENYANNRVYRAKPSAVNILYYERDSLC